MIVKIIFQFWNIIKIWFFILLLAACSPKGSPDKPNEENGNITGKLTVYDEYGQQLTNLSGFQAIADNGSELICSHR